VSVVLEHLRRFELSREAVTYIWYYVRTCVIDREKTKNVS
jgi:hypothetical protein